MTLIPIGDLGWEDGKWKVKFEKDREELAAERHRLTTRAAKKRVELSQVLDDSCQLKKLSNTINCMDISHQFTNIAAIIFNVEPPPRNRAS